MTGEADQKPRPAPGAVASIAEHPQRLQLIGEMHARPYATLQPPARLSHLLLLSGEQAADAERECIARLCTRYGAPTPAADLSHFNTDFNGLYTLRWERHTEFSVYTFIKEGPFEQPFSETAIQLVPHDWLAELPGEALVGLHLAFDAPGSQQPELPELARQFASNTVTGAIVAGGKAAAWTDHQVHADGFGRVLIHDISLNRRSAGRLAQRIIELTDYRMMALLALPVARALGAELSTLEERLDEFTTRLTDPQSADRERRLLTDLTGLAAQGEQLAARYSYRFSATRAYYAIVERRIAELREQRFEGLQTFQEFQQRRLDPAMATCESAENRLGSLNSRIARASDLLRTRVDIELEEQNRDLLESMDRRAQMQLRLQETVEGLSVVVLSYYLVGLISYLLKGGKSLWPGLPTDLLTAVGVIPVGLLVFFGLRRLRQRAGASRPRR